MLLYSPSMMSQCAEYFAMYQLPERLLVHFPSQDQLPEFLSMHPALGLTWLDISQGNKEAESNIVLDHAAHVPAGVFHLSLTQSHSLTSTSIWQQSCVSSQ